MSARPYIYFDNNATTCLDKRVFQVMKPYFLKKYGNASSMHLMGRQADQAIDDARGIIARSIGAHQREVLFTSSGTESDNMAIFGYCLANMERGEHVITSKIEHPAVLRSFQQLEHSGLKVTYLPVDGNGRVRPEELSEAMTNQTILVSIMTANNEIGTVQPIRELARIAHEKGAAFHTDAIQAVGKMSIDVERDGVDLLSLAAHKFHGPKGVGALYARKDTKLAPIMFGGMHEYGLRPSTENVPGIVGMGEALRLAMEALVEDVARMSSLRDRLIGTVLNTYPGTRLNGHPSERLCNNANISFPDVDGQMLVLMLDKHGIAVSTGSACSTKNIEPSHVLKAIWLTNSEAKGSLRIGLSRFSTNDEVDRFLEALPISLGELGTHGGNVVKGKKAT
jgi:cysteine desulfurase